MRFNNISHHKRKQISVLIIIFTILIVWYMQGSSQNKEKLHKDISAIIINQPDSDIRDVSPLFKYTTSMTKIDTSTAKRSLILLWIPTYRNLDWIIPNTSLCGGGCDLTKDRNRYEDSDAVVFYMKGTNGTDKPHPSTRRPDQPYIWWCHESPSTVQNYWHKSLRDHDGFFNWTMHYRTDSYISASLIPHTAINWYMHRIGRLEETISELEEGSSNEEFELMFSKLMKAKSKSASWVVSDCDVVVGALERMNFTKRLIKQGQYDVDIFGKCGTKEIPPKTSDLFEILQSYRFYLSFENTRSCKQYISEKFWYNSLYAGTVPVVWGPPKESVEKIVPPNSFIHVDDFNGDVEKLADHLRMLENDTEAYKEYFRWWTMPGFFPIFKLREAQDRADWVSESVFDYEVNGFCHLCRLLKEGRHKSTHTVVSSLRDAFYGKDEQCL